ERAGADLVARRPDDRDDDPDDQEHGELGVSRDGQASTGDRLEAVPAGGRATAGRRRGAGAPGRLGLFWSGHVRSFGRGLSDICALSRVTRNVDELELDPIG